jgi:hypothetical protein
VFRESRFLRWWSPNVAPPENLLKHVHAFLCYPGKDLVTPYAVHLMTELYGPREDLWDNLGFVVARGFIGATNMIQTERLLRQFLDCYPSDAIVIRYSRQKPDYFAISRISLKSGAVTHHRNTEEKNPDNSSRHKGAIELIKVPIKRFVMDLVQKGYHIGDFHLDDDAITASAEAMSSRESAGITNNYHCMW